MAYNFLECIFMLLGVGFCPFNLIFIDLDMLIDLEMLISIEITNSMYYEGLYAETMETKGVFQFEIIKHV